MQVYIQETAKKGKGLFASKPFKKSGEVYSFPKGRIITKKDLASLTPTERNHLNVVGVDTYEIFEPPACYVNHSCEPNIYEGDHCAFALRTIEKDEEITVDYGEMGFIKKPFRCHCGAKQGALFRENLNIPRQYGHTP